MNSASDNWMPPSSALQLQDGLWQPHAVSSVSYPDDGNEICFQIEDSSYWFSHRNECILSIISRFPPSGTFYDVGGGNGFVAMGLQNAGLNVALLEPGSGAKNALKRGVKNVIWAALGDSALQPQSLPAAGAFDVVEHIEDDVAFLSSIRELLLPGGRFYCTVPAIKSLWSAEDVHAGHYRRYTKGTLRELLETAGFEVEYTSFLFSWLVIPVFLFRSLPWRLRGSKPLSPPDVTSAAADHSLPDWLSGIVRKIHETEQKRVQRLRLIPFGTSLICVARKR